MRVVSVYRIPQACYTVKKPEGRFPDMIVRVLDTEELACELAAMLFASQLAKKPCSVLSFATGSTPIAVYRLLTQWHRQGLIDFSHSVSFNLDEYVGLAPEHPCSYRSFMEEHLFRHVNLKATSLPNGVADDLAAECSRYDSAIADAGGIDLQLLGIGLNGHIGFNEPASTFSKGTNVVSLSPDTISANKRFFPQEKDVPQKAITMGIGSILSAQSIVLLALGSKKAPILRKMMRGEIDPELPASILHMHKDVTVLLDRASAADL